MKYSGKIHIVYDGMWGSCGKGKFAGLLALSKAKNINVSVSNNAPNAGHTFVFDGRRKNVGNTFVFDDGRKVVVHQLPIGIINPKIEYLVLGESSVINIDGLLFELEKYKDLIGGRKIYISDTAAIVSDEHIEREKVINKTGSTFTGSGEALVAKIRREANAIARNNERLKELEKMGKIEIVNSRTFFPSIYNGLRGFSGKENILAEVAQGYGLSLNGQSFPNTTSRDCTPAQAIKDIHATDFSRNVVKYCVVRPYPIRINNCAKNGKDEFIYTGGFEGASDVGANEEESWKEISRRSGVDLEEILSHEMSTTTHRLRRVAEFSPKEFEEMLLDTNPHQVIINFAQYNDCGILGLTQEDCNKVISDFNKNGLGDEKQQKTIKGLSVMFEYLGQLEEAFPSLNGKIGLIGTGERASELVDLNKLSEIENCYEARNCPGNHALKYADFSQRALI